MLLYQMRLNNEVAQLRKVAREVSGLREKNRELFDELSALKSTLMVERKCMRNPVPLIDCF